MKPIVDCLPLSLMIFYGAGGVYSEAIYTWLLYPHPADAE